MLTLMKVTVAHAAVGAAILLSPTSVEAAPKDPLAALRKQLIQNRSVTFTEQTTSIEGGDHSVITRRRGVYEFGQSGVAASDIRGRFMFKSVEAKSSDLVNIEKPERVITIGKTAYISGGMIASSMPPGKTWLKTSKKEKMIGLTGHFGQPLNVADPAVMKRLLETAEPTKEGYRGTFALKKASPFLAKYYGAKTVLTWRLTLDVRNLPALMVSTYPVDPSGSKIYSIETRFSSWGGKSIIQSPSADKVTENIK